MATQSTTSDRDMKFEYSMKIIHSEKVYESIQWRVSQRVVKFFEFEALSCSAFCSLQTTAVAVAQQRACQLHIND